MKNVAFDVMLDGKRIDTVFQPVELSAGEVKLKLIRERKYDNAITVERLD